MLHIGTSETLLVPSFLQVDLTLVDAMLENTLALAETLRSDLQGPSPRVDEKP